MNMKIKSDFVTNSSSTSYIIYLPENFDVLNAIKEKKPELLDRLSSEKNKLFLNDVIEKAKKDSEVLMDSYDWVASNPLYTGKDCYEVFDVFHMIISELGLIVDGIDTGPDDIQIYINVGSSKAKEKIKKIKSITGE